MAGVRGRILRVGAVGVRWATTTPDPVLEARKRDDCEFCWVLGRQTGVPTGYHAQIYWDGTDPARHHHGGGHAIGVAGTMRWAGIFVALTLMSCAKPVPVPPLVAAEAVEALPTTPVAPEPLARAAPVVTPSQVPPAALKYRSVLTREAHFVMGLSAPIDYMAGQIHQESGWRPGVTAFDGGAGIAQFMAPTAKWVAEKYGLGDPQPYDPLWAIRAMTRLDAHNLERVRADTDCDRWGAALKSYNAGAGYVQKAQKRSETPGLWFGKHATEWINAGQSAKNFEASRMYPRWIIFKHAPRYAGWGHGVDCEGRA